LVLEAKAFDEAALAGYQAARPRLEEWLRAIPRWRGCNRVMLPIPTRLYLEYARFLRRYHRFSAEGIEKLYEPGAKLVVAYHGAGCRWIWRS
jgi:hypothetical protein